MAIPVDTNTELLEEQYRRLERILYELYLVLRALMEPQVQTPALPNHQGSPRGGSGGGSRRSRRRPHSSRGRRFSPSGSTGSNQQSGSQNPPPPPPPTSGNQAATTVLLNLANSVHLGNQPFLQKQSSPCTKNVESSVEWGTVGLELKNIADSSKEKSQGLSPLMPSSQNKTSSSSGSSLKLVTLALSLMLSRNWSLD
ncbi:Hypothetical predicted protein [Cloeon dipterum]|uniref:Uncharacterized protein n=1 Tax=Cloeon dipterum TaxID=197152 RepID=A0A8S1C362_9INSE|nr:Hypothetical predicted protein [Cloeon dipterum]